eukprot:2571294-Rhodomonas_salina.2
MKSAARHVNIPQQHMGALAMSDPASPHRHQNRPSPPAPSEIVPQSGQAAIVHRSSGPGLSNPGRALSQSAILLLEEGSGFYSQHSAVVHKSHSVATPKMLIQAPCSDASPSPEPNGVEQAKIGTKTANTAPAVIMAKEVGCRSCWVPCRFLQQRQFSSSTQDYIN